MSHDVVHFEVAGPDGQALEKFYSGLFGWKTEAMGDTPYVIVHRAPGGIGGGIAQPPDGNTATTFYVSCPNNIAETLAKAESMGATTLVPVSDVPGGPTIALFNDPDGNMIGLVNATGDEQPVPDGTGAPVNWFEIGGKDGAKTQKWYSDLFGWKVDANNPMQYGMVPAPEGAIGGGIYGDDTPGVRFYVNVEDLNATLKKAGELGGKTIQEPVDVPGGPTMAHFADPVGNMIGLTLAGSMS
jgi:hypothetical protein